jgi:hypothetical protein
VIVPKHGAALGAEATFGGAHLGGFIVLVECKRGDVDPGHQYREYHRPGYARSNRNTRLT